MSGILIARRSFSKKRVTVVLPSVGSAFMGGYYAGIIDTTKGNIIAADASQTGLRYALVVAPKSLESSLAYKTTNDAAPTAASTRWDGLTATTAMNSASYPAANYCNGLTYPSDGGSAWYLPAMDEFEIIYRNLKCSTESNSTTAATTSTFPGGSQSPGYNPSSDPTRSPYTSTVPAQTGVTLFKSGGAQALGATATNTAYWTATEYAATYAWRQYVSGGSAGSQINLSKFSNLLVRPVRRVAL